MSIKVHSFILNPSDTVRVFCTDGLSSLDIANIKYIYNFGGQFKLSNCGVGNEAHVLRKTYTAMFAMAEDYLVDHIKELEEYIFGRYA